MREIDAASINPGDSIIYNHRLEHKDLAHLQEYCDVGAIAVSLSTREILLFVNGDYQTPLVLSPTEKVLIIPRQRDPID